MKQSPDCEKIKLPRKHQNRENQGTIKQNQSTDEGCYIEHICDLKNKTICKKKNCIGFSCNICNASFHTRTFHSARPSEHAAVISAYQNYVFTMRSAFIRWTFVELWLMTRMHVKEFNFWLSLRRRVRTLTWTAPSLDIITVKLSGPDVFYQAQTI